MKQLVEVVTDDLTGHEVAPHSGWEVSGLGGRDAVQFQSISNLLEYYLCGHAEGLDGDHLRRELRARGVRI